MTSSISRSVDVSAPAERVWELVSDLPGMGSFSPENTGGSCQQGVTGPGVGAVFRGSNGRGRRRWSYEVVPTEQGCTVTETWEDRRGRLISMAGGLMTGVPDREGFTAPERS